MAEQIKFELDSDETFDILKDIGDAENELGKQCWKDAKLRLKQSKSKFQ